MSAEKIQTMVEDIAEAVNQAQEANDKAISELKNETVTTFDKHDALLKETQKKATEAATSMMEEIQNSKLQLKGIEEHNKYLERQISRLPASDQNVSEFEQKARSALMAYMRRGERIEQGLVETICEDIAKKTLIDAPADEIALYTKTLIAGNNPQGGYYIRPERSAMMIQRIFETSPVRSIANVTTTNTDALEFVVDDNEATTGGWVGEVNARGITDTPDIGLETIPIHEQFAQPKATQKMLDDAGFDIEAWLSRKVTDIMTRTENGAFINGDGSQKPRGIISYPAWDTNGVYQRGHVEQVLSTGASAATTPIADDDLKVIQNSLIEDYQANAIWGIKRASFEFIITLKDGQGRYIFDQRNLQQRDPMNLLGKTVIFMNDLPEVNSPSALGLIYGDFSLGYTIVDRIGFRVIRDEFTDKPFIKFYTTKRTGAAVTNYQSYKILRTTLTP